MTWTIRMPFDLASKNAVKRNPHERKRRRDSFAGWLIAAARQQAIPVATRPPGRGAELVDPVQHRRVTITRIMRPGQRSYDDDGLQAGDAVLLRDAMQPSRWRYRKGVAVPIGQCSGAGLINDDSPTWATFSYAQERGAVAGVRVEIQDAPELARKVRER